MDASQVCNCEAWIMYRTVRLVERNDRGSIYFNKNKISCIKIYPGPAKTEENREWRKRDGKKGQGNGWQKANGEKKRHTFLSPWRRIMSTLFSYFWTCLGSKKRVFFRF